MGTEFYTYSRCAGRWAAEAKQPAGLVTLAQVHAIVREWRELMWQPEVRSAAWADVDEVFSEVHCAPLAAGHFLAGQAVHLQNSGDITPMEQYDLLKVGLSISTSFCRSLPNCFTSLLVLFLLCFGVCQYHTFHYSSAYVFLSHNCILLGLCMPTALCPNLFFLPFGFSPALHADCSLPRSVLSSFVFPLLCMPWSLPLTVSSLSHVWTNLSLRCP
jgi:hypothetical protein